MQLEGFPRSDKVFDTGILGSAYRRRCLLEFIGTCFPKIGDQKDAMCLFKCSLKGFRDQTKCLTPASLAARTAAVACLSSLVPASRKLVTRKTPCASSNAA